MGLYMWSTTNDPVFTLQIALGITVLAAIPTWESMWLHPQDEDRLTWTIFSVSCVPLLATLPALHDWRIENAAQPLTFACMSVITLSLLFVIPLVRATAYRLREQRKRRQFSKALRSAI